MPSRPSHRILQQLCCLALLAPLAAAAAPFVPSDDAQVLERLPARASDPQARALDTLRRQLAAHPRDADIAVRLARAYYQQVAAEGDPRYIGYAQAALGPWWDLPDPPLNVRVTRAILRQFNHQFDAAQADLQAAVAQDPEDGEAWSWLTAIQMVQARYGPAREGCGHMASQASPLIVSACLAAVDSVTGHAAAAAASLHAALAAASGVSPAEKLWALTRLGEIEERRGAYAAAEAAFRQALDQGITDGYLLAAYADFLLDRGRPDDVLALLKGKERSDLLLLRLAIAARAAGAPQAAGWTADLGARFDAARLRGDTVHQKEEARFALALLGQPQRALVLAEQNYKVQREPADARVLLEAALAAQQPAAAAPVLQWMADTGIESVVLRRLAERLKGRP